MEWAGYGRCRNVVLQLSFGIHGIRLDFGQRWPRHPGIRKIAKNPYILPRPLIVLASYAVHNGRNTPPA